MPWLFTAHAEGDEEMDIDDPAAGAPDESAYIGDNCLSTPVSFLTHLLLS